MTEIITAGPGDLDVLSHVIAEAFRDLPPSQWLIGDRDARTQVFPAYFRIYLDHALASGVICTTPDRDAAALWIPVGETMPSPPPGYDDRLRATTAGWTSKFIAFDTALERCHPAGMPHHYLAILAVRPGRQGRGIGTALLAQYHQLLDQAGMAAYLEASSERNRSLYLRYGYVLRPDGPFDLPDGGPPMWPLWREPQPAAWQPGEATNAGPAITREQ
jgi:GNAT superfamily N-acetyltransferase